MQSDSEITDTEENQLRVIRYKSKGRLHRLGGPAIVRYTLDGRLVEEGWYKNGEFHRIGGPAQKVYVFPTLGVYTSDKYIINGIYYTKEEYDEYFRNIQKPEDQELLVDLGQSFE